MGNLVERAAGELGTGANHKLHIGVKLTKAVLGKVVFAVFQRQRVAVSVIRPAVALAADDIVPSAIDRLTPGRYGDAVADCKVGNVMLLVQHDIFFLFGGKRVVTIRIRAGQAAVIDSAVDVVKFV